MSTWKDNLQPSRLYLGVVEDRSALPFEVTNFSETPFGSYTRSCSCVGEIQISEDGMKIQGTLIAEHKPNGQVQLFPYQGMYIQKLPLANGQFRYRDVVSEKFVEGLDPEQFGEPVTAYSFNQSIVAYAKSDEPLVLVKPNGEQQENSKIQKVTIPVQFYVLPAGVTL